MTALLSCACGASFELKSELGGLLVRCPDCGAESRAAARSATGDPAFDRDVFLLRQKALRINEVYDVTDQAGAKILFAVRPAHVLRSLLAAAVFVVLLFASVAGVAWLVTQIADDTAAHIAGIAGGLIGFAGSIAACIALAPKRHVAFFRDAQRRVKVLEVLQDRRFQPIRATYTVKDGAGNVLARFEKNVLLDLVRRRWSVLGPAGELLWLAKEDSLILALLRRLLGSFYGLLRTNFVFTHPATQEVMGELKRRFTILDRYVLDLTSDPGSRFDRRIAVALGVMLDTGERR